MRSSFLGPEPPAHFADALRFSDSALLVLSFKYQALMAGRVKRVRTVWPPRLWRCLPKGLFGTARGRHSAGRAGTSAKNQPGEQPIGSTRFMTTFPRRVSKSSSKTIVSSRRSGSSSRTALTNAQSARPGEVGILVTLYCPAASLGRAGPRRLPAPVSSSGAGEARAACRRRSSSRRRAEARRSALTRVNGLIEREAWISSSARIFVEHPPGRSTSRWMDA